MSNWLVIYDISDAKRLSKVAKLLQGIGQRVQKSVFEVIAEAKELEKVRKKVRGVIDPEIDSVIYFRICEPDWQKRKGFGSINFEDDKPFQIL